MLASSSSISSSSPASYTLVPFTLHFIVTTRVAEEFKTNSINFYVVERNENDLKDMFGLHCYGIISQFPGTFIITATTRQLILQISEKYKDKPVWILKSRLPSLTPKILLFQPYLGMLIIYVINYFILYCSIVQSVFSFALLLLFDSCVAALMCEFPVFGKNWLCIH